MRQSVPNLRQIESPSAVRRKRVAIMLDLQWPYRRHCDVYAGVQQFALENGAWECVVDEYADATLAGGDRRKPAYDGIIARATPALAEAARRCRVPVVNVWFNSPVCDELPSVYGDQAAIGKAAAEHLLERGFRRFACLSGRTDNFQKLVVDSFHRVIQEAGFKCQCQRIHRQFSKNTKIWSGIQDQLNAWIERWKPPLGAFITFPDVMGRIVADCCRRHGVVVPDDAALIVCDNEPALCLYPPPSLTSVDTSYHRIGFLAGELLEELMRGRKVRPLHRGVVPTGIVARQSTDFFAVQDPLVEAGMRFISANVHRPIQVDDVSEGVFAGRRTLERRFHTVLGRTVAQEIIRLRLERAKRELAGTDASIKSISDSVGFRDAKRMHEVFLRELGMSPSQYRERLRQP